MINKIHIGPNSTINQNLAFCCIFIIWAISPILSIPLILLFLYGINFKNRHICYFFLSISFSLLAFTQISTCRFFDTDIVRYYSVAQNYLGEPIAVLISQISIIEFSYVLFTLLTMLIVSLTQNVQYMSLLWVFIIYFFYFLSIENYIKARKIKLSPPKYALLVFISIFGFILFTQVTETIKQAAATSVFFVGFTYIMRKKILLGYILVLSSILIHAAVAMLIPLLLYKRMTIPRITILTICAIILSSFNIMHLISMILSGDFFSFISDRAEGYSSDVEGFSSSIRYILLILVLFSMIIWCRFFTTWRESNQTLYIGLLYIVILILNYPLGHNFVRYVNMSYCVYAYMFIEVLASQSRFNPKHLYIGLLVFSFIFTNMQMTIGRTISNGYTSAYMDNSLYKILFSNPIDYLRYKAY